jgi:hypothetical protein
MAFAIPCAARLAKKQAGDDKIKLVSYAFDDRKLVFIALVQAC